MDDGGGRWGRGFLAGGEGEEEVDITCQVADFFAVVAEGGAPGGEEVGEPAGAVVGDEEEGEGGGHEVPIVKWHVGNLQ